MGVPECGNLPQSSIGLPLTILVAGFASGTHSLTQVYIPSLRVPGGVGWFRMLDGLKRGSSFFVGKIWDNFKQTQNVDGAEISKSTKLRSLLEAAACLYGSRTMRAG